MRYFPDKKRIRKFLIFEIFLTLTIFLVPFILLFFYSKNAFEIFGLIIVCLLSYRIQNIFHFTKSKFKQNRIESIDISDQHIVLNFPNREKCFEVSAFEYDSKDDDNRKSFFLIRLFELELEDIIIYKDDMEVKISGYVFNTSLMLQEIDSYS